ncbi:SitI3 family protein [Actinoplanes sp. NPDC051851]|uniref:SitI3 family protein n=1 Tax=Actinoplanes sp. NPDC051851 TaxID=3154753 RepID=UPI00342C50AD
MPRRTAATRADLVARHTLNPAVPEIARGQAAPVVNGLLGTNPTEAHPRTSSPLRALESAVETTPSAEDLSERGLRGTTPRCGDGPGQTHRRSDHGYARLGALDATPLREDPEEQAPIAESLGFTNRLSVTYRLANRATDQARDEAISATIRSVLAFFDHYPSDGALLFNDSRVILQRVHGAVVIDRDWEDWTDIPDMREIINGLEARVLPQPLL